ncbi:unnamed protein product, partial [Ectocarpus sp. 12 AP-2014]
MSKKLVLCNCLGSQSVDADGIAAGSGLACSKVYSALCMDQIGEAAKEIASGDAIIACQQERACFEELAEELDIDVPGFVDLRDRAGWSDTPAPAKMAALAAEAALQLPIGKSVDVISEGTCLILGGDAALQAAADLCRTLAVTVLVTGDSIPTDRRFDCVSGTIKNANGALGQFQVTFDNLRQVVAGGRGALTWGEPLNGAASDCDIILD